MTTTMRARKTGKAESDESEYYVNENLVVLQRIGTVHNDAYGQIFEKQIPLKENSAYGEIKAASTSQNESCDQNDYCDMNDYCEIGDCQQNDYMYIC